MITPKVAVWGVFIVVMNATMLYRLAFLIKSVSFNFPLFDISCLYTNISILTRTMPMRFWPFRLVSESFPNCDKAHPKILHFQPYKLHHSRLSCYLLSVFHIITALSSIRYYPNISPVALSS